MKWIFIILLLLVYSSCAEIPLNESKNHASQISIESNTLSIEEALKELEDFNQELYASTHVKSRDVIADISICSVPFTRSEKLVDNILAYIVNYKDNQGFAVINSDRSSMPILVRAESGTLDTNKLNEMILRLMDVCQTKSDISMSPMEDKISPEEFIYEIIAESLIAESENTVNTRAVYGEWNTVFKYGPLVTVKWNQTYPFNLKIEPHEDWLTNNYNNYRGLPPVGCGNVALGQILATIRQPSMAPGEMTGYEWGVLKSLSNYTNVSYYLPGSTTYLFDTNAILMNKVNQLADFLNTLYVLCESETSENGTSSYTSKTLDAMQILSSSYFADAEIISYESDNTTLVNCIQEGKPVFCRGDRIISDSYTKGIEDKKIAGHAWVVDGYTKRKRTITTEHPNGGEWTGTQLGFFFHINWGYSGMYDGYYNRGVFDMSQREDYDDMIDTYPDTSSGNRAYTLNVEYIGY